MRQIDDPSKRPPRSVCGAVGLANRTHKSATTTSRWRRLSQTQFFGGRMISVFVIVAVLVFSSRHEICAAEPNGTLLYMFVVTRQVSSIRMLNVALLRTGGSTFGDVSEVEQTNKVRVVVQSALPSFEPFSLTGSAPIWIRIMFPRCHS